MLNIRFKFFLIFAILLGIFLLNTQYTTADIFAERNIRNNSFKAASLNFFSRNPVNNSSVEYIFKTVGVVPEGYDLGGVKLKRDGNVSFKYYLRAVRTNGDENFCNNLTLQVLKRNLTSAYQGKLMDLGVEASINDDNVSDWIFLLSLNNNSDNLKNKICEFNLEFKTFRNNHAENSGIHAKRILTNVVSSGTW